VTSAVRFLEEASVELEAASEWYEQRRNGLGMTFLAAVETAVEVVAAWPKTGAPIEEVGADLDVRRARVHGFPYHLAYLVTDDVVYVLAVAHDRRRPGFWRTRLGSETE
jgi:plasmid stabilization system protein ParE